MSNHLLFVSLLFPLCSSSEIELIQTLARDRRFTCVTMIVEHGHSRKIRLERNIIKTNKILVTEFDDVEKIVDIVDKSENRCLFFTFLPPNKLQKILDYLSKNHSAIFTESTWYLWVESSKMRIDPKLVGLNSELNFVWEENFQTNIKEVYSLSSIRGLIENIHGSYNDTAGLVWKQKEKWIRRRDLHGLKLKIILIQDPGYLNIDEGNSKLSIRNINKIPWHGIIPDIFESIAKHHNFTYDLRPPRDGKWGTYDTVSKSWNGVVQDIMEGVADMAAISMTITFGRSQVVDFSYPIITSHNVFLVNSKKSYSWDIYLSPFTTLTWVMLYITMIVLTFTMTLVTILGREENIEHFRLRDNFVFVFGSYSALAARRWNTTPSQYSGRYCMSHAFYLPILVFCTALPIKHP